MHALAKLLHGAAKLHFGKNEAGEPLRSLWRATVGATTFTVEVAAVRSAPAESGQGRKGAFDRLKEAEAFLVEKALLPVRPYEGLTFKAGIGEDLELYVIKKATTHEVAGHWLLEVEVSS